MASKLARYRRKKRRNPDESAAPARRERSLDKYIELGKQAGAAFGGYAATRLLGRIVYARAAARWPRAAKHLAVGSGLLAAAGAHLVGEYWDPAEEFREAMVLGSGVAVAQSALQAYIPRFGWLVSDWEAPAAEADVEAGTPVPALAAGARPVSAEEIFALPASTMAEEPIMAEIIADQDADSGLGANLGSLGDYNADEDENLSQGLFGE